MLAKIQKNRQAHKDAQSGSEKRRLPTFKPKVKEEPGASISSSRTTTLAPAHSPELDIHQSSAIPWDRLSIVTTIKKGQEQSIYRNRLKEFTATKNDAAFSKSTVTNAAFDRWLKKMKQRSSNTEILNQSVIASI